jgi:hypothetical protein
MELLFGTLKDTIAKFINLLPSSPFQSIDNTDISPFLGYLNWIVPISEMVAILELYVTAIGIYYIYMCILRWIKVIS